MAPKESVTLDVGYPVYAAQFVDEQNVVVTGGGGEGNNGIPNKISNVALNLDNSVPGLKVTNDYEFEGHNDSPTALAIAKGTLLVGINEESKKIKAGTNKSLRKFNFNAFADVDEKKAAEAFAFDSSVDLFDSEDPNDYVKLIAIAPDSSFAAVVSSKVPSTVYLINPETMTTNNTIEDDQEIRDIAISPDGKRVAFITEKSLTVIQDDQELTVKHNRFTSNYNLAKVKFSTNDKIICGVNLKNNGGVLLLESSITKEEETGEAILKTTKARVISDKVKKLTSMDLYGNSLAACAGNDNSIIICDLVSFKAVKVLQKVHTFAITKVVFSPNGKYLASVSAASTINVYKIPDNIATTYSSYYSAGFFLLLAFFGYYIYENVPREKFVAVTVYLDKLFENLGDGYDGYRSKAEVEALNKKWLEENSHLNGFTALLSSSELKGSEPSEVVAKSVSSEETPIAVAEKLVVLEDDIVSFSTESEIKNQVASSLL